MNRTEYTCLYLFSNAVKFTHEGKVGVKLKLLSEQYPACSNGHDEILPAENFSSSLTKANSMKSQSCSNEGIFCGSEDKEDNAIASESASLVSEEKHQPCEKIVLLHCDVYDTGIGIPGDSKLLFLESI